MKEFKEVVVTFNDGNRKISMYFTPSDEKDGLNMQMAINPELKEGEEPDMPLLLANVFMQALKMTEKDGEPTIIEEKSDVYS